MQGKNYAEKQIIGILTANRVGTMFGICWLDGDVIVGLGNEADGVFDSTGQTNQNAFIMLPNCQNRVGCLNK